MNGGAYVTSFSMGFCSSSCFFLPPHRLTGAVGIPNIQEYHIYLVARAPRARLVPGSLEDTGDGPSVRYRIGHEFAQETHRLHLPPSWGVTTLDTPDGAGLTFHLVTKHGELRGDFPLLLVKSSERRELRDHEVVYVGQAYGAEGSGNVLDRLLKHETLQRIVAENAIACPSTDILVYGFTYTGNDQLFMMFDGTDKSLIGDQRDDERRNRALANPPTDKQMTQIVEAALIRYFQPEYNKKFRSLFPGRHHRFLDDLRDLDHDGFIVEINTEDLKTRLYSGTASAGQHHIVKVKLTNRITHPVFSFFRLMKDVGLDPTSGPAY